jgi:predicted unusual protein kinase regulating ubiquinone biosynthesis (AarF/ABC1/UbiB family)
MPRTTRHDDRRAEAQRLSRVRDVGGLTQRDLAEAFRVGQSTIAQWEAGERTIPGPALVLLEVYERHLGLLTPASHEAGPSRLARGAAGAQAAALWLAISGAESVMPAGIARHAQAVAMRQFVKTVGNLKGLSLKLAQMAVHGDFVLPEEQRSVLASLQATASPMPSAAVVDTFLDELGKTPREIFAEWSPKPVAVASVGQVHRAKTRDGLDVAVKVQYPQAVATLKADLENVALLGRVASLALPGQRRGVIYEEVRARLLEECDYRLEAQRMGEFRERFRDRADVVIPRVVETASSEGILTASWVQGRSFDDFAKDASQGERDRAGSTIWDFYCRSFFRDACFHADPHPGNLLFTQEAVAFLDFGRVKELPKNTLRLCRHNVRS